VLFGPGRDSGTFDYFTTAIVGNQSSSRDDYTKSTDYTVVARGVESDPNALGYFGYAYFKANKDRLKLLAIDSGHGCIEPSPQTVIHNTYQPLSRPLLLYITVPAASRSEVREFVQLYLNFDSAQTVSKIGYVPLPAAALTIQNTRFENGVTGSALGANGAVPDIVYGWFSTADEKVKAQLVQ
jgi:phosphate transport system substrate-binding protein